MNSKKLKVKSKQESDGFTYIELIIVIAIIAAISVVSLGVYRSALQRARNTARKNDLRQYQVALNNYANLNNNLFPSSDGSSIFPSTLCGYLGSLLQKCLSDTWNNKDSTFQYNYQSGRTITGTSFASKWVLWAKLEGRDKNWHVCSNGKSGERPLTITVTGGDCPL